MERYLDQVEELGYKFCSLIGEAFGLGPEGLSAFFDVPELMQHRAKIVQYPVVQGSSDQGVGPHYDAGFLTFVSIVWNTQFCERHLRQHFITAVASILSPGTPSTKPCWGMDRRPTYSRDLCNKYWKR